MEPAAPDHLHGLLMDLVQATGLLHSDQVLPGQPVSMSQVFALHALDADPPLSQRDLAATLGLDKSSVSRLAADLERKGLLARERDPDNRRHYRLVPTDAGRALHARVATAFHERFARWFGALTPAERDALLTGLPALLRVIHDDPAPAPHPPAPHETGGSARDHV